MDVNTKEIARLVYDKIMGNDQHTTFDHTKVEDPELVNRMITFRYEGIPFVIVVDIN